MVDFPDPDAPTRAVLDLALNLRLTFDSTGASGRDGYAKLRDLNDMMPGCGRRTCPECSWDDRYGRLESRRSRVAVSREEFIFGTESLR